MMEIKLEKMISIAKKKFSIFINYCLVFNNIDIYFSDLQFLFHLIIKIQDYSQ